MKSFPIYIMVIVFLLVLNSAAGGAVPAWPMFGYDAMNTGRTTFAGPDSPVLAWSYRTGGPIDRSSPAIDSDGRVFIGSSDSNLYSLASDGMLSWSYKTGSNVWSSPALALDGRAYVGSSDDNLYALTSDGSLLWSYKTAGSVWSSPTLKPGRVYTGSQEAMLALSPAGGLAWSYKTGGIDYGVPAAGPDGTVYASADDNYLYAFSSNGSLSWSYETEDFSGPDTGADNSPAINADGRVHVGSEKYDTFFALASDGLLLWSYEGSDSFSSRPALGSDGRTYIGCHDSNFYAFTSAGAMAWSYETGDMISSSAALGADGKLFVGSEDNRIYCIDPGGSLLWSYETGLYVRSSPAIGADGRIHVGTDDNTLYVLQQKPTATPTPTVTPTTTPVPNYVNLGASPGTVSPGGSVNMSWSCDFGTWNYQGKAVNVYVGAIRDPKVIDGPSSTADALAGGMVYLAGPQMKEWYPYTGSVKEPTWSNVAFPPAPLSGTKALPVPNNPALAGDWVFATAFIYSGGSYVRGDGKPVENSPVFSIQ